MSEELQHVEDLNEYESIIKNNKFVVVDCFAVWCGPCKRIAPTLVKLSKQYPEAKFIKVDVEKGEDISAKLEIEAMPTFILYKDGEEFAKIVGADEKGLISKIKELLGK